MERQWSLEESTVVDAPPARVYAWVSDLRTRGRRAEVADLLGTVFAGTNAARRAAVNRAGMRTTLTRIAHTASTTPDPRVS